MTRVLLVDAMPGVCEGLRWILAAAPDMWIIGEEATIAAAAGTDADVIVSGLRLPDGAAADLVAWGRAKVVVHTWLPSDERAPHDTVGVAQVVLHGSLRETLAPAIRRAAGGGSRQQGQRSADAGSDPERRSSPPPA